MKKTSFFLFLILLLSVVCSVNASETITLPETCTQSDYFIVIAGYDEETIRGTLTGTVWDDFAPSICGISGNTIYVSSEADMARLLQPLLARSTTYASVFPSALITTSQPTVVYHGYLQQEGGISDTFQDTYLYLNNTELVKGYMLYRKGCYSSYDGGRGEIYLNDIIWGLSASGNPGYATGSVNSILPFDSVVHWDVDERWDWGADAFATIVIFGEGANNGTFEGSYVDRFTKTEFDSASSTLTVNTNIDGIEVYDRETLLGVVNNGEGVSLVPGIYNLTFVKSGYWNESVEVTVISGGTVIDIEMFPEDELYLVSTNIVTQNIVPNEVVSATVTIEPKYLSKDTKIHFSKELESVKIGVSDVSMYGEDYILGDISEPTTLTLTFNSGTLTGNRYIEYQVSGTTWLNAETLTFQKLGNIDYFVNELPIIVYMPTWEIGENEFRIIEQEGNTLSLNVEILDSEENSIYEQNKVFNPYGVERFTVNLSASGSYFLRIYCSEYDILLPFTVGTVTIEDDTEDDTIPPIVDDSEGIFDMILNYWYFPVGLIGIVGISKLFFGKKGRKDRKKTNKGGNKK